VDFQLIVSILSALAGVVVGLSKKQFDKDIEKYFKVIVKLVPLINAVEVVIPVVIPAIAAILNEQQVAKSSSVVGLYYIKKRNSVAMAEWGQALIN
jgi:hypothetical protein